MKRSLMSRLFPVALIAAAAVSVLPVNIFANEPSKPAMGTVALGDRGDRLWSGAMAGDWEKVFAALADLPGDQGATIAANLRHSLDALKASVAKRDTMRVARIQKVSDQFDEAIKAEQTPQKISECLKHAVELHELAVDPAAKEAVLKSPRVQGSIARADLAAREAEAKGDWLMAGELFGRLNILLDTQQTYKADARRLGDRLALLRLYAPKRLWDLRNERREMERKTDPKLSALPPYNGVGDGYEQKLSGITQSMVVRAVSNGGTFHVERGGLRPLLLGGLEAVKTMVTTPDLRVAFPELDKVRAREAMVTWIDRKQTQLREQQAEPGDFTIKAILDEMMTVNKDTTRVMPAALLHEFGNGAFEQLDDYSNVVWPDEFSRFMRMMESNFVGVGIQIQFDEDAQKIKVVTPLDGSSAMQEGIRPGDYILKINDDSAVGMATDQAVDLITGKAGTKVRLTMERDGKPMVFELTRKTVDVPTVKGWQNLGSGERNWDYMIDKTNRIGYVRLTQFSETSSRDLRKALNGLKAQDMQGLILDLRFNPGGLLNEAVNIASMFVNNGEIVWTQRADGRRVDTHEADPNATMMGDIPVIVLVNTGSASASEIVSGALRFYADQGKIKAMILGTRTYGKGSVQNVVPLPDGQAKMKLTTQYYYLPGGRVIHRRKDAAVWGVDPHLTVEMLPQQISDAVLLRSDADLPASAKPVVRKLTKDEEETLYIPDPANFPPSPDRLVTQGIDLQLQTALYILQAQAASKQQKIAGGGDKPAVPATKNPG